MGLARGKERGVGNGTHSSVNGLPPIDKGNRQYRIGPKFGKNELVERERKIQFTGNTFGGGRMAGLNRTDFGLGPDFSTPTLCVGKR